MTIAAKRSAKPFVRGVALFALIAALGACSTERSRLLNPRFEGHQFRASAKAESRSKTSQVIARAQPVSLSQSGALQSAEHQAKAYCLRVFGSSEILWDGGSLEATAVVEGEQLSLRGTCQG